MTAPRVYRSEPDQHEIEVDSDLPTTIAALNRLITAYTFFNKSMSIQSNFDGYIAEDVVIPATSSINIQHYLGVTPKWRILLKQTGNGVITDIPSDWDDKVIALYNNGAVEVTITVFIARE